MAGRSAMGVGAAEVGMASVAMSGSPVRVFRTVRAKTRHVLSPFRATLSAMRADRLLSILLLLQSHGRLTARRLAERLEVSERTINRDMEALSIAGVPVYAERGRHGGWELAEAYRTDLTGLTESELRSLVLGSAPAVLAGLGLGEAADRALVKLLATLPESRRREAESARRYLHVDPGGWRRTE